MAERRREIDGGETPLSSRLSIPVYIMSRKDNGSPTAITHGRRSEVTATSTAQQHICPLLPPTTHQRNTEQNREGYDTSRLFAKHPGPRLLLSIPTLVTTLAIHFLVILDPSTVSSWWRPSHVPSAACMLANVQSRGHLVCNYRVNKPSPASGSLDSQTLLIQLRSPLPPRLPLNQGYHQRHHGIFLQLTCFGGDGIDRKATSAI